MNAKINTIMFFVGDGDGKRRCDISFDIVDSKTKRGTAQPAIQEALPEELAKQLAAWALDRADARIADASDGTRPTSLAAELIALEKLRTEAAVVEARLAAALAELAALEAAKKEKKV